jgi:RHS repeat-associated protein
MYNKGYTSATWHELEWKKEGLDLNYFAARYYDPIIGRWHAPDPLEQCHSPYTGMVNDPANFVDPDGRLSKHAMADFFNTDLGMFTAWAITTAAVGVLMFADLGNMASGLKNLAGAAQSAAAFGGVMQFTSTFGGVFGGKGVVKAVVDFVKYTINPLPGLSRSESYAVARYIRTANRHGAEDKEDILSLDLDEKCSVERWYWKAAETRGGKNRSATNNRAWNSARTLTKFALDLGSVDIDSDGDGHDHDDGRGERLLSLDLGSLRNTLDPDGSGRNIYSLPISGSGNVRMRVDIVGEGSTHVEMFQGDGEFGMDVTVFKRDFDSPGGTSDPILVDISVGDHLTIRKSGLTGSSATYTLIVDRSMVDDHAIRTLRNNGLSPYYAPDTRMRLKDRGTRNVRQRKTKETIRILHQQAKKVGK